MVRILTLATASKPTTTPLREPRGIMKPREVSPKMQALMGAPEISRTQDLKQIWAHIKQNNLQIGTDKAVRIQDAGNVSRLIVVLLKSQIGGCKKTKGV
ncbi:unnamed protein product [Malus baccata var. baccata]